MCMCDTDSLWTHYSAITVTPTSNDCDKPHSGVFISLKISVSVALHLDEDFPDGKSNLMNGRKSVAATRSVSSRGKGSRGGEHHWMQFNWKSGQAAIFEIEDAACYHAQSSFDRESFL